MAAEILYKLPFKVTYVLFIKNFSFSSALVLLVCLTNTTIHANLKNGFSVKKNYNLAIEQANTKTNKKENFITTASKNITMTTEKQFTEIDLLRMIKTSPNALLIKSEIESFNSNLQNTLKNFSPRLRVISSYSKTNETPLIEFEPPEDPFYSTEVLVEHQTRYGFAYSAGIAGQSLESKPTIDSAQINPKIGVHLDLWKNRFGRRYGNQIKSIEKSLEGLKKEETRVIKSLENLIKQFLWNYTTLQGQININKNILKLTENLVNDLNKKKRSGFVESSDVLEAKAELSSQEAQLSLLKYQNLQIRRGLLELLPELPNDFEIQTYNIASKTEAAIQCFGSIMQYKDAPVKYSLAHEKLLIDKTALGLLKKSYTDIGKPDLKIQGEISSSHVDPNLNQAIKDYSSQKEFGYSVGLELSIPLGSSSIKERRSKIEAEKLRFESQEGQTLSKLYSVHQNMKASIQILKSSQVKQEASTKNLNRSYKFKKKQFEQARADLSELIIEQNRLLASQISELSIINTIAMEILNYKNSFENFPCGEKPF